MNEGENSGMSNGPIFSSPNIAGSQPEPEKGPVPMPEQPVDVTKTDNPIVTTTLASMPGDEQTKPTITSGGDAIDKKKPRFGLGTRRFKEKNQASDAPIMQAAQSTAFANAPEFFNDAVGDIVLADAADAEKKNKTKKFIIIGVAVAIVLIAGLAVGLMMLPKGGSKATIASKYNRLANLYWTGEDSDKSSEAIEKYQDKTESYAYQHRYTENEEYVTKLASAANDYFKQIDGQKILSNQTALVMQSNIELIAAAYGTMLYPAQAVYNSYLEDMSESKARETFEKRYSRLSGGVSSLETYYSNAVASMEKGIEAAAIVAKNCASGQECKYVPSSSDRQKMQSLISSASSFDNANMRMLDKAYDSFSNKMHAIRAGSNEN